jgi:CRISPR-associated protein Cas5h
MKKVISFDLYSDMGFLKKPDINEKIYLTYNMLHKPCVLGILGAIAGLKGFTKNNELPEYYNKFKNIPIGVKPIGKGCERGNFTKNVTTYTNTIGFANADGNLIISEQTLINPAYRIFLLLDLEKKDEQVLYDRIWQQEATYIPYLGKNDYSAWWYKEDVKDENDKVLFQGVKEYDILQDDFNNNYKVETVFIKQKAVVDSLAEEEEEDDFSDNFQISDFGTYVYFEKLPIKYNEELYQYDYADFSLTDSKLKAGSLPPKSLFHIQEKKSKQKFVVQLN